MQSQQSDLVKRLFHRQLSDEVTQHLETFTIDEPPTLSPTEAPAASAASEETMPRTIRELLTDSGAREPRYVRLHYANYTTRELLSEILSMANRIVRRISDAQLSSTDRRWWPIREMASKWDSIRAYPEMLQDADVELLKILVLDGYADMERLEAASGTGRS